jgi:phosphate transport system substrate-binding protein
MKLICAMSTRVLTKTLFVCFVFVLSNCSKNSSDKNETKKEPTIITIKGSDSELNLLKFFSNEYKANRPEVVITITGGGTAHGIKALIDRETDIAIASRLITKEELEQAKESGIHPVSFIIAQDVVAIITHPKTGVDSLSLDQLTKVLSGSIKNWKELGGEDLLIKTVGRDKQSGTRYYLKDKLSIKDFPSNYIELKNNAEIIYKVSKEIGSIGYVNVGSIVDQAGKPTNKVWAMNLFIDNNSACSPYENQRIKYGEYPLVRPLIQYTNGKPSNQLLEFINFELLEKQQARLEKHGYLKINSTYFNMNQTSFN